MKSSIADLLARDDGSQGRRRRDSIEPVDDFVLRVVSLDGKAAPRDTRLKCSFAHACEQADRMQAEIDADGELLRVLVVDCTNVPVAVGGENPRNRKASKAQQAYLRGPNWPRRATER